ncbi:MAG: hypothetical protein ACI9DM_000237 [Cyclobacteriaceae bacterium]|jgi:hypothetical protein
MDTLFDQPEAESKGAQQGQTIGENTKKILVQPQSIQEYYKFCAKVYTEELMIEQFKENYYFFLSNKDHLAEIVRGKKVREIKIILHNLGRYVDSTKKKESLVKDVVDNFESLFVIADCVSYDPFSETYAEAKKRNVESITAEQLAKFYTDRKAEEAAKTKALDNPETLQEFNTFVNNYGEDKLSPEQAQQMDNLKSDAILKRREETKAHEAENRRETIGESVNSESFEIHETKHSKTGADIFTVRMIDRVDKNVFISLRTEAKKFGGYYSRYTDRNANPPIHAGFNFDTQAAADEFLKLVKGEEVEEPETDNTKTLSKSEKLQEMGKRLIEKANEELNRERLTNTHRRAAQAASTESKATGQKQFGQLLIKISEAFERGEIKYLDSLNNGAQLSDLNNILRRGYEARTTWRERENGEVEPNYMEDVNFVKFPWPQYHADHLQQLFTNYKDEKGMKRDIIKFFEAARRGLNKDTKTVTFDHSYDIELIKKIGYKIADKWEQERLLNRVKDFERIYNMGITNLSMLRSALRELGNLKKGTGLTEDEKRQLKIKEIERSFIGKKIAGFFPTPEERAEHLVRIARIQPEDEICEPEAGLGHIADVIAREHPQNSLSLIEFNHALWKALEVKGYDAEHENFLSTTHKYDVFIMNPPFEKNQDIEHIMHAWKLLKDGGRIAAIAAGNKNENSSQKQILEFIEFVNENGYMEKNPSGSFKNSFNPTGVETVTIYLEK